MDDFGRRQFSELVGFNMKAERTQHIMSSTKTHPLQILHGTHEHVQIQESWNCSKLCTQALLRE